MAERYGKVVIYSLNCDEPEHDRVAFAKSTWSDPKADEFRVTDWDTVIDARNDARNHGWKVTRSGKATCPMCLKRIASQSDDRKR